MLEALISGAELSGNGPLAQWIRRRPPEPEIPGSSPGRINFFRSCWKTTSAYISAGFCSCTCESIAMSVLIAFAYVMRWLAENFPKRILGFFVELLVNNERVYNTGYSSVGRASDCRFCRHQMVPGSIPGGRIFCKFSVCGGNMRLNCVD